MTAARTRSRLAVAVSLCAALAATPLYAQKPAGSKKLSYALKIGGFSMAVTGAVLWNLGFAQHEPMMAAGASLMVSALPVAMLGSENAQPAIALGSAVKRGGSRAVAVGRNVKDAFVHQFRKARAR